MHVYSWDDEATHVANDISVDLSYKLHEHQIKYSSKYMHVYITMMHKS